MFLRCLPFDGTSVPLAREKNFAASPLTKNRKVTVNSPSRPNACGRRREMYPGLVPGLAGCRKTRLLRNRHDQLTCGVEVGIAPAGCVKRPPSSAGDQYFSRVSPRCERSSDSVQGIMSKKETRLFNPDPDPQPTPPDPDPLPHPQPPLPHPDPLPPPSPPTRPPILQL